MPEVVLASVLVTWPSPVDSQIHFQRCKILYRAILGSVGNCAWQGMARAPDNWLFGACLLLPNDLELVWSGLQSWTVIGLSRGSWWELVNLFDARAFQSLSSSTRAFEAPLRGHLKLSFRSCPRGDFAPARDLLYLEVCVWNACEGKIFHIDTVNNERVVKWLWNRSY